MSNFHIGARIRTTRDFPTTPRGSHGVIDRDGLVGGDWGVTLDNGQSWYLFECHMEVFTPVFASHYQAQPIMDEPAPATDDAGPTPDTPLSGEELMNITRSFCR